MTEHEEGQALSDPALSATTHVVTSRSRSLVVDGEVVEPMAADEARRLDQRIRLMAADIGEKFGKLRDLVEQARAGHIHVALGYKSWPAYVADAVAGSVQQKLAAADRAAVVELLADVGMSARGIAQATGVGKSTVARDLSQVSQSGTPGPAPVPSKKIAQRRDWWAGEMSKKRAEQVDTAPSLAPVIGLDGKRYPRPAPKPPAPRRRSPLPDAFRGATYELGRPPNESAGSLMMTASTPTATASPTAISVTSTAFISRSARSSISLQASPRLMTAPARR